MISIRRLFVLISLLYSAVMAAGFVVVHFGWLHPEKIQNALERQQSEQTSILRQLDEIHRDVDVFARDYAGRQEILDYFSAGDEQAIANIFTPDQFALLNLNDVIFLPVHSKGANTKTINSHSFHLHPGLGHNKGKVEINNWTLKEWVKEQPWLSCSYSSHKGSISGFARFANQPYMTSLTEVRDTSGQLLGQLVFMRQVNDTLIERIAVATDSQIRLIPPYSDLPTLGATMTKPEYKIRACKTCPDGSPSFCLETRPRVSPPQFLEAEGAITVIAFSLLPLLVSLMALSLIIEPLRRATQVLEQHHEDGVIEPLEVESPISILEFKQLGEAYNAVAEKVSEQQVNLEALSNTDRLTGIPNRRAFDVAVREAWNRILRRSGNCIALVMVDIDHFKQYNDTFGHQAGDEVLTQVAQALQKCSKRADELVARYGGEEFALIIYVEDMRELDRYRHLLKEAIAELDIDHPACADGKLTISAGMSWINQSGCWLKEFSHEYWVELADVALYQTKLMGRNNSLFQVMHKDMKKENHNTFEDLQQMKAQMKTELAQLKERSEQS